jgi:hypothetical protein
MTHTASQVWSRAIARSHGSLSFTLAIQDVALILPHISTPRPSSSNRSSGSDFGPVHDTNGLLHRPSLKSLKSRMQPKSFASVGSLHTLFQHKRSKSNAPIPAGGYQQLLGVEGDSKVVLGLGFGPKKGLLGEDTLRTKVEFGKVLTTLDAVEKIQGMLKSQKPSQATKEVHSAKRWSPRSFPRVSCSSHLADADKQIVLRAFESVSISLLHFNMTHQLPISSSSPISARSSVTDMSDFSLPEPEAFGISLDVAQLSCKLDAADSSNDHRARNAFGSNTNPESIVRGIAFALRWNSIGLQCLAPGEKKNEMSQLVQMRTAEFEGLSTWRPEGWSREEMLFASDPNLALVLGKGSIDSIDVAGDVQLLDELRQAWQRSKPERPPKPQAMPESEQHRVLPPRFRIVLDVGHAMVLLADRVSEQRTTLTLASDGLHLGCFTNFSDLAARRRDKVTARSAFKREEELRQRREEAGDSVDYALPDSMLKPELRRHFERTPAVLQDDYAMSMRAEAVMMLEPMSLHMTLSGRNDREQQTYHLASVGRAHGTFTGDILGRQEVQKDGRELASLDPSSISCLFDLGIDSGVKVNLYSMPVIEALTAMAQAHQPAAKPEANAKYGSLLCRLPSGISVRLSLGLISVFIGHQDPNPNCPLKLTRGLWLQTTFLWEYAYYCRRAQVMRCRHSHSPPTRSRLRLPEDITTQALAFENALGPKDGRAALFSFTLTESFIKPIFNGDRFADAGGTSLSHRPVQEPKDKVEEEYVGWDFRRPQTHSAIHRGMFSNNVDPLELSDTDQAARPLLRIKRTAFNWAVIRTSGEKDIEHKLTGKVDSVDAVCDLSHVYCSLLAAKTVRRLAKAVQRPHTPKTPGKKMDLSIEIVVPSIKAHLAFPLREHLFIYVDNAALSKLSTSGFKITSRKVLAFVPCPRDVGTWDELARIKALDVQTVAPGQPQMANVNAEAMRIRIPFSYQMSKLVLNINVTIKAIKLLTHDLDSQTFETVKKPGPEGPKHIPRILINVNKVSLEAKDDPIETNLNLIWRAGIAEQEKRNELEDNFETKMRLITERQIALAQGIEDEELDKPPTYSKLTDKLSISPDEARYRLDWYKSKTWTRRIRLAKQEQCRREQAALRHMEDAGLANVSLPITINQQTLTAPLFRLALDGFKFSVEDLGWSREQIIEYMGDVSTPFDEGTEFSLMVPLKIRWSMDNGVATLRDYPLPLIRIPSVTEGNRPAWNVETPMIIAEELQGDDSQVLVPTQVIPPGCGASDASPFTVEIAKTIMPVKTYSRPIINISTDRTTEFTWGNSYQPAIQDFMKVVESLSHPPRDPSPRVGFWDKFKLILHWKVTVNFESNAHLHLKGSSRVPPTARKLTLGTYDPYYIVGNGAGFALSWKGGTKLEVNQPNDQHETIQISAQELLIAIPESVDPSPQTLC